MPGRARRRRCSTGRGSHRTSAKPPPCIREKREEKRDFPHSTSQGEVLVIVNGDGRGGRQAETGGGSPVGRRPRIALQQRHAAVLLQQLAARRAQQVPAGAAARGALEPPPACVPPVGRAEGGQKAGAGYNASGLSVCSSLDDTKPSAASCLPRLPHAEEETCKAEVSGAHVGYCAEIRPQGVFTCGAAARRGTQATRMPWKRHGETLVLGPSIAL